MSSPPENDARLAAFVAESPIHRAGIALSVKAFAADLPAGSVVLDAGAGDAPYRHLFAHCDYRTQDWPASPHALAGTADIIGDLRELPVEDDVYDAIVCTEVLEHIETPDVAVAELLRVLTPGGRLLVTVPFVGELHEEPHDHYRYTSHGLGGLLSRAGFEVDDVRPLTGYFQTLAHVMRVAGSTFRPLDGPAAPGMHALTYLFLAASKLAERPAAWLDRRDRRRALPIGWVAHARVPRADA